MKYLILLLTLGLTQASLCQNETTVKLDELLVAYNRVNKFNGTVLVARGGTILLEKGYGYQSFENKKMNGVNTQFSIYSVTKTFTSTLIFKMIEEGRLSLSDKLSRFYPSFPSGDSITIEHLLSHTSGIYEYTRGNDLADFSEKPFVEFLAKKPFDFSPGKGWSYCNSGYWLLGFIIERLTGATYEQAVSKYIFSPLNMKNSGFGFKQLKSENKAVGYEVFEETVVKTAEVYGGRGPYAAGAIYSTVGDLYRYYNGLQQYKLLKKATLQKAFTPVRNNYAYGWMINQKEEKKIVSHSGGAAGFRSNFVMIPEEDICITVLNNHEQAGLEKITSDIINILMGRPYTVPREIKLSNDILQRYTGYYLFPGMFTLTVNISFGRLAAQAGGQPLLTLLAQQENIFYVPEADAELEFKKDSVAGIDVVILHQGGRHLTAKRIFPSWGVLGSATEKGWTDSIPDIELKEDVQRKNVWIGSNIKLKKGEIKFRFNNQWKMNYGDDNADGKPESFGKDISVAPGEYDIILDLSDDKNPVYRLMKKK
jgi:CubicO group peptidase (beta-lactamase class C family)